MIRVALLALACAGALSAAVAPIKIWEVDNITQTGRVHTFGMMFKQSDIANCAVPVIGGVALDAASYQCDVKTRWPDGSLQRAVISMIANLTALEVKTVSFQSGSCNNAGFLDKAGMLAFNGGNWDGSIEVTANGQTVTSDAKAMLTARAVAFCQIEYDLQGPIVTKARVQDCTAAFSHDFGWHWDGATMLDNTGTPYLTTSQYASLHPIFDLTFVPSTNAVKVEAIIENQWTQRAQDQIYSVVVKTGSPLSTKYTHASFTHISRTNWRKTFWSGTAPGHVRMDWNFPYLISTGLIPNYDQASQVTSVVSSATNYTSYTASDKGDILGTSGMQTDLAANDEGALEQYEPVRYLYAMADCSTLNCAKAWALLTGEVDVVRGLVGVSGGGGLWAAQGSIPIHARESRAAASYYCPGKDSPNATNATACGGSVNELGRGLSRDAHPNDKIGATGFPVTPVGTWTLAGWNTEDSCAHWLSFSFVPAVLLGDRYSLEELYSAANECLTMTPTAFEESFGISGWWANMNVGSVTVRAFAWGLSEVGKAALAAPDGTLEKAYYLSKIRQNIEMLEGFRGLTGTNLTPSSPKTTCAGYSPATATSWDYAHCTIAGNVVPPLYGMTIGQCIPLGSDTDRVTPSGANWFEQVWFSSYAYTVLGDLVDKGFAFVAPVQANVSRRLIEWTQDPTGNPYHVAAYASGLRNGPGGWGTCASSDTYLTFAQIKAAQTEPDRSATSFPGILGNFGCADHGYSLLARAAGTFVTNLSSGSYTGAGAWAFLNANAPYFAAGCGSSGDTQIKYALAPRTLTVPSVPVVQYSGSIKISGYVH